MDSPLKKKSLYVWIYSRKYRGRYLFMVIWLFKDLRQLLHDLGYGLAFAEEGGYLAYL
jgi:hypothetical protein